jgi:uncharacterized membrane protein YidH (DUF202 family)
MDEHADLDPASPGAKMETAGLVLANRRTALALAVIVLVMAGVLAVLPLHMQVALRIAAEVVLILVAGLLTGLGWLDAHRSLAAMQGNTALPRPTAHLPVAIGLALAAALLATAVLIG